MRRRRAIIGEETEEIDLTPMLDVVFIMLIFFIVTATFVKEIGIDVNSPDKNQNVKDADKQSIVVQITNRDRIRIRGRDIDFRAVRANIERLHYSLCGPTRQGLILVERGMSIIKEPIKGECALHRLQLVPRDLRHIVLIVFHTNPAEGHFGVS